MKVQLRIHLFSLFGIFFVLYFVFIFIYTQIAYVKELKNTVDDQLDPIIEDRLVYSTQAVSTMFYMIDKLGIDSSKRLSGVYQKATQDTPFPIKANAEGYELFPQADLEGN